MRIHHVSLTGFGPYKGAEEVDFDAFADDGIFLITGRTGAGKTSILDAITYALFGRIPRYDAAAGDKVRSDHLDPTEKCEVTVEFSLIEGRHRITRRPAYLRPKQRGDGLTPVKAFFEMSELRDGQWVVTETKEGNADRHVSDVLPLTAEQFQQVILLAQGQFQEFLVAGSDKRREVLSKLFDTSRFTAYSHDLDEQARLLRRHVEKLSAALGAHAQTLAKQVGLDLPETVEPSTGAGLQEWAARCLAQQEQQVNAVQSAARVAVAAFTAARTHHDQSADVRRRQDERTVLMQRQLLLAERTSEMEQQRARVALARRAALAEQSCAAVERAEAQLSEAARVREAEIAAWRDLLDADVSESGPGVDLARSTAEAFAADLLSAEAAGKVEAQIPALRAAAERAEADVEAFEARLQEARAQRGSLTERLDEVETRAHEVSQLLADLEDAASSLSSAQEGLKIVQERDALEERLVTALAEQKATSEAARRVQDDRDGLVARQFAQYAGVLAAELSEGTACLVCGSTSHPQPAVLGADHVDADTLEAANEAVAAAQSHAQHAAESVARLGGQVETLTERSEGLDIEGWTLRAKSAAVRVEALKSLQAESRTLQASRTELNEQITALTERLDTAQAERLRLTASKTSADQSLADALSTVTLGRAQFSSVAARTLDLRERRGVAQRTESALRSFAEAQQRLDEAVALRDTVLLEHQFSEVAAVREAVMVPETLERVAAEITAHDEQCAVVRDRLASSDLHDLPDELVDLTGLHATLVEASAAHSAAAQALGAAEHQHSTVARVVAHIDEALAGSAAARAEYELVNSLASTLRGQGQNEKRMALESFALAAELEEIVTAANLRLGKMTGGRFEFRHSDTEDSKRVASGLGLEVLDAHTGEARSPKSLSGGEKFQASLALALGLAEVVTARSGGLRLDTLFIDEGFGTLDPETLESTMATLNGLREGGRTIGLISHVAAMKETIACQLHVEATPGGWSTVRQR